MIYIVCWFGGLLVWWFGGERKQFYAEQFKVLFNSLLAGWLGEQAIINFRIELVGIDDQFHR